MVTAWQHPKSKATPKILNSDDKKSFGSEKVKTLLSPSTSLSIRAVSDVAV